ncbi:ferritin-like domain-containing protein [Leifsonia sp. NPDC058230]|uniref:ferritin-like domain-containing protein n=1 Tax=Leifsonia sp. NPDC058230 TaxID=3346391 RepID=UPI0036D88DAB
MFDTWTTYFRDNRARQLSLERHIDWSRPCLLSPAQRRAFGHSFQRFELGENGDGRRLLAKATAAGDPWYTEALALLVAEEQRHSALFGRGLQHLGVAPLQAHWSDTAFVMLRRMLGLRTEIALFLIAESVAIGYFEALQDRAPDPVLRAIGRRVTTDEVEHLRFQIDRLRVGFASSPRWARMFSGLAWGVIAAGAAAVLVSDHRASLRACGLRPSAYWGRAMRRFRAAAVSALAHPAQPLLGPSPALALFADG